MSMRLQYHLGAGVSAILETPGRWRHTATTSLHLWSSDPAGTENPHFFNGKQGSMEMVFV
jgi:hypothetical protein